jgi:hypothetical protein
MCEFLFVLLFCYAVQLIAVHIILVIERDPFIDRTAIKSKKDYFLNLIPFAWFWFLIRKIYISVKDLD